jgi:hypothetical protein
MAPHADFARGSAHFHDEVEELNLVTRGSDGALRRRRRGRRGPKCRARRVAHTALFTATRALSRSRWAISHKIDHADATKIDDFWGGLSNARGNTPDEHLERTRR